MNNAKEGRKFSVLEHVIREFVSTSMPVSSKVVAHRMGGSISSATVRNIMAEMEDGGYIAQPHTSAGRVPTNSGYRHYVDTVKHRIRFERKEAERLAKEYTQRIGTIKEVIEKTSFLLSRELHNAGIVMWPNIEDFHLKHIELVKIKAETILAVLVTMTNAVENHIVRLDRELGKSELERVSNYINTNYERSFVSRIYEDLSDMSRDRREGEGEEIIDMAGTALKVIDSIIYKNVENEIYWEGLDYFMDEPEFRDINLTKAILGFLSERKGLVRFMRRELPYRGLKVYIGEENTCETLRECSIITSGYELHGRTVGRIGVIGPARMNYDNALRTVSCLSDIISAKLEEIEG